MLDLFDGGILLTSVLGSALWGLLITVSISAPRTQDPKLRKIFVRAQAFLWGLWLSAWCVSLVVHHASLNPEALLLQPVSRTWLIRTHAFLLAGASGLVLLFGCSSFAGLLQMRRLQSTSWKRRSSQFQLPSIESLARVSSSAVFWAFTAWGVGLALATLTLIVSLESHTQLRGLSTLASDPQILMTCLLWVLLGVAFLIQNRSAMVSRQRATWLASLATLFWCSLAVQAWMKTSSFHEPLRWFLK
ncbi:MAG: hypothetical protein ABIR96_09315 [Bdellovibrionota bacterium]